MGVSSRSCCSSYLSLASSATIVLPWLMAASSLVLCNERCTSSMPWVMMTGHRERADVCANDVASLVLYWGTGNVSNSMVCCYVPSARVTRSRFGEFYIPGATRGISVGDDGGAAGGALRLLTKVIFWGCFGIAVSGLAPQFRIRHGFCYR